MDNRNEPTTLYPKPPNLFYSGGVKKNLNQVHLSNNQSRPNNPFPLPGEDHHQIPQLNPYNNPYFVLQSQPQPSAPPLEFEYRSPPSYF
jgi:hypothetical protein